MDAKKLRILVTGVDGDSGQGLVKALRMSRLPATVVLPASAFRQRVMLED